MGHLYRGLTPDRNLTVNVCWRLCERYFLERSNVDLQAQLPVHLFKSGSIEKQAMIYASNVRDSHVDNLNNGHAYTPEDGPDLTAPEPG